MVALGHNWDGSLWFPSTKELQLASLEFCAACRSVTTMTLTVDENTPRRLLTAPDAPPPNQKRLRSTRVPRLRALQVLWNMSTSAELRRPIYALANVTMISFGVRFTDSLDDVLWPHRLSSLSLSNKSRCTPFFTVGISWPTTLQKVTLDGRFDELIGGVVWPTSMTELRFGTSFNQPIEEVKWPVSLQRLRFGFAFDQPIHDVNWPASLEEVTFGDSFNQPIERVTWPRSIRQLLFGEAFEQPIERVMWPDSLAEISFGTIGGASTPMRGVLMYSEFDEDIGGVTWPASMRRLTLGSFFSFSCAGLGRWMPNLEELGLFLEHRESYRYTLGGIEWPSRFRKLIVYKYADLRGLAIPSEVQVLRYRRRE